MLRIVETAQELRECRLPGAVRTDDRERGAGRDREVELIEHRDARRRVREVHTLEPDLARRNAVRRTISALAAPARLHLLREVEQSGGRLCAATEPPVELADG